MKGLDIGSDRVDELAAISAILLIRPSGPQRRLRHRSSGDAGQERPGDDRCGKADRPHGAC